MASSAVPTITSYKNEKTSALSLVGGSSVGNSSSGEWFLTRLAIVGSPLEVIQAAVSDLIEEIGARPHLRSHGLLWDADAHHVRVEVENWGYDPEHAANGMAEELFEIAAAVLGDYDEFHVEILAVDQ